MGVPAGSITLVVINAERYHRRMIRSFKNRQAERIWRREAVRGFSVTMRRAALRKLLLLDAADVLDDLRSPPGNRLEKLTGRRRRQHSIRINDQWRIRFRWVQGDAQDVEIVAYH